MNDLFRIGLESIELTDSISPICPGAGIAGMRPQDSYVRASKQAKRGLKASNPNLQPNQPNSRGNNSVSMDSEKPTAISVAQLLPRFIRFRDAPFYLGMDRNRFNTEVRPYLTKIPIGRQGIAFDRLELDAWVEEYISRNGRSGRLQGERLWDAESCPVSTGERAFGTSTNRSKGNGFAKALDRLTLEKPNASSQD